MYSLLSGIQIQAHKDSEILLASDLKMFSGPGANDEIFYVCVILMSLGLGITIVAINAAYLLRQLTVKRLLKIIAMWLLFATGVSIVSINVYLQQPQVSTTIHADEGVTPRQVRIRYRPETIVLSWRTDKQTTGQVLAWSSNNPSAQLVKSNQGSQSCYHQIELTRRNSDQMFISVISDGYEYRQKGEPLILNL